MLTVGSLFSGIGGFDLGLEQAGMRVIWQSEIDPYASAVLRKHWPTVPNLGDIRGITAATLADAASGRNKRPSELSREPFQSICGDASRMVPGVLCGGFPCQDISNAGKRAGIEGNRSGLWAEFARVIGELRPRYVIVENVAALLGRGIERVLGDLAALGFDAEWHCIPASAVGAPHRRDRVWIVAYAERDRCEGIGSRINLGRATFYDARREATGASYARDVSDADCSWVASSRNSGGMGRKGKPFPRESRENATEWWGTEPDVGRVAHGIPARVDRLRCLGNAIVPQIAEIIGRAIVEYERMRPLA